MQNHLNNPYTSEEFWRKRPHPSRVNDYDSDESSTTGSPWRAMKRLRVGAGSLREDYPEPEPICSEIERVVSQAESHTESAASSKDEDYANFNKLLGALHLERMNRDQVRSTSTRPVAGTPVKQPSDQERQDDSMRMTTPLDKGRARHTQTKLKTNSKLA
jgi:hypothetical protein